VSGELDAGRDAAVARESVLTLERFLRHPPEAVWRALTDPAQLREWFLTEARIDGREGGTVDLTTGPTRVRGTGRILEWHPPRLFEYEWNVDPVTGLPHGERATVRWELTAVPGGTRLVLSYRGLTHDTAENFQHGIPGFLDRLMAQLDGRPLEDWLAAVRAHRVKRAED
jgi:uncharacterized protein YndB with AHSA1/START domain